MKANQHPTRNGLTIGVVAGAVVSALAASLCCVGPLVVGALGVGGAAAFAKFERYRYPLSIATVACLALGFVFAYRKPAADVCGCPPKSGRWTKAMLWIATFAVVTFLGFPAASRRVLARHERSVGGSTVDRVAVISVAGMSCASCAIGIRGALQQIPGVDDAIVDVDRKEVRVRYRPDTAAPVDFVTAIERVGFPAKLQ